MTYLIIIVIWLRMKANKDDMPHVYSLLACVKVPFYCRWLQPSSRGRIRTPKPTPNSGPRIILTSPDSSPTCYAYTNSIAIDEITMKDWMGRDCVSARICRSWCDVQWIYTVILHSTYSKRYVKYKKYSSQFISTFKCNIRLSLEELGLVAVFQ